MTQHRHHTMTKSPQQRRHQHDSTLTSRRGHVASAAPSPAWLDNAVTNMTWYLHRAMAKSPRQCHHQHDLASTSRHGQVASAVPSLAWLSIDIVPQPSHLNSAITSLTRQRHRQHDSASTSRYGLIVNINNDIWFWWQANTLPAHTGTIHQYTWFQGWFKHPVALLGTSIMHLHFEDSHLKILNSRL
jgi:hypothetical protein